MSLHTTSSFLTTPSHHQVALKGEKRTACKNKSVMNNLFYNAKILLAALMMLESIHDDRGKTVEAFQLNDRHTFKRIISTNLQMSQDYLSSLSALGDELAYAGPLKKFPSRQHPSSSMTLDAAATLPDVTLHHATRAFFNIDQLTPKGPRVGADAGAPHDSSRSLVRDLPGKSGGSNTLSSGSWWCAQGGWPSKKLRATTEIFYVFEGFGCLTDLDGRRSFFGPGDTVILPKGWSGRWDVAQDIHKVWFVHDHDQIEEDASSTIRARIIHYNEMVTSHNLSPWKQRTDATHGTSPQYASKTFYEIGPTDVGYWICTPGSFSVTTPRSTSEGFHVLEGVFFLTNYADGTTQKCVAGDTVVLPKGWTGEWDVIETVQKLWVEV